MKNRGFTLIELLVVIGLIGLMSVFVLPNVTSYFKLSMNTASREMASVIKEAYNSAMITGRIHRLVYDFKNQKYWVESGEVGTLIDTIESREIEKRRKRFTKEGEGEKPSGFHNETTITPKKGKSLPRGIEFDEIKTEQSPEPIREGLAYTHIFPNGISERTSIFLKDKANHWVTLVITPILGRSHVIERKLTPDEINSY